MPRRKKPPPLFGGFAANKPIKHNWTCPSCGTHLELRMRVTQNKRRCPNCGTPITTKEIDKQKSEQEMLIGCLILIGILVFAVCAGVVWFLSLFGVNVL